MAFTSYITTGKRVMNFYRNFFESYICNSFLIDNNKRLWIGTNKGLFREKRSTGKIERVILNESTEKEESIHSISVANNKVFAGTENGLAVLESGSLKKIQKIDLSNEGDEYVNFFVCSASLNKDTLFTGSAGFDQHKNLTHGRDPTGTIRHNI
jgi:ligand-binding sensor domain-containing protein